MEAKYLPLLGKIIRHARRVQRELGPGHPELLYHRALLHELRGSGDWKVSYKPHLKVRYGGRVVGEVVPDLLVRKGNATVLIECKVVGGGFEQVDFDQVRRYLRVWGGDAVGLLLGFGGERLEFRRVWLEQTAREEVG
ncbi:MAG: GxxExxY protein [Thermanaerothrix sp.]|uniref:GxxExxY protein n=1 Tax=Thermanaerothrix sp. TaxID=2972675 RepID=UPI003C797A8B